MLNFFRSNIKIIVWFIVLSFVAWGAGTISMSRNPKSSYAGSIYGKQIPIKEYLSTLHFYDLLSRSQANTPETSGETNPEAAATDKEMPAKKATAESKKETEPENPKSAADQTVPTSYEQIRATTWQTLLLSRAARREKLDVSDEEVKKEVERLFSGGGAFDVRFYDAWIDQNFGGHARGFEEVVRRHLLAQKYREHFLADIPPEDRQSKWLAHMIQLVNEAHVQDYQQN